MMPPVRKSRCIFEISLFNQARRWVLMVGANELMNCMYVLPYADKDVEPKDMALKAELLQVQQDVLKLIEEVVPIRMHAKERITQSVALPQSAFEGMQRETIFSKIYSQMLSF